ncbi:rna-directed dna polymerase from mobile element jockey-like [Limosa lapponica baueri]|uniref:Rna-directed dna polymerase from mobile element jockey-like n=1 Tax=Limosa lapponica baueri TaxID=1758121 RepID=A0A2I0UFC8_LIMLA|nr:rna-directed dna polymerase from mobile element jockey-like [Limosa lapponica baueri]
MLFNIFVGDMDSGTECTFSKFDNEMKLCGAVNMLEGRDAIQRDLDRLERCLHANLVKFNKPSANSCRWIEGPEMSQKCLTVITTGSQKQRKQNDHVIFYNCQEEIIN